MTPAFFFETVLSLFFLTYANVQLGVVDVRVDKCTSARNVRLRS